MVPMSPCVCLAFSVCIERSSPALCVGVGVRVHDISCMCRMFWPKSIWGQYGKSLADFKNPANATQAVQCLNHMVTDALR